MNLKKIFRGITIKQICLTGIFLSLLTVFKFVDLVMPRINGIAAWEIYYTIGALMVIVLSLREAFLVLIAAPLLWLAIGQTTINGPFSIFLDYFVPMLSLLIIKLSFTRIISPFFVLCSGVIKYLSQSLAGKLFWDTDWWPSLVFNFPFNAITTSISIVVLFLLFRRLKSIHKVQAVRSVSSYIAELTGSYISAFKTLRNGYLNKAVVFEFESKSWLLKISNSKTSTLENEYLVTKQFFADAKINEQKNAIIRPYIKGTTAISLNDFQARHLVDKIENFHNSKLNLRVHDWNEFNRYLIFLPKRHRIKFLELVKQQENVKKVPSHNDINMENILVTSDKTVELIDFEWARMNDPLFDYASIYVYNQVMLPLGKHDEQHFKDLVFMLNVFGYLWTFVIPFSLKAYRLKKFFLQNIKKEIKI